MGYISDIKDTKEILKLNKIQIYSDLIKKLSLNDPSFSEGEKTFMLSCAILLMREYSSDRRRTSFAKVAYYIILKYSLLFNDFEPLYDFCVNMGFYPIAQVITNHELLFFNNIPFSLLSNTILKNYGHKNIIETIEQKNARETIISSNSNEISFVAPTSFGKSSIIIDHLVANLNIIRKVGIIVPTKSLLTQTYRTVKAAGFDSKILIHDEMYTGEDRFIAIFTQERALRLLGKHNEISFEILYVDEAHRILERDSRSVLLLRLIKINKMRNPASKVIYLSPLVTDSNNLTFDETQNIFEKKIVFSVKEPEYYEYRLDGAIHKYNRFTNTFYFMKNESDIFSYIMANQTDKSFFYLRSPRKIENFAKELSSHCRDVISPEIQKIIINLKNYVHEDFYAIEYLKKGVIYLHGKMPENVKEYLEYKFSKIPEIKLLIANTVILEGINLPIDSLFILNTCKLDYKGLTNLIGRVNRLDQIFDSSSNKLNKLLPQIHFINTKTYNNKKSKMENQIRFLKNNIYIDNVENPLLSKFDMSQLTDKKDKKKKCEEIISNENIFFEVTNNPVCQLKQKMIALGIANFYKISDELCSSILGKINDLQSNTNISDMHVLDKLHCTFLSGNIKDSITDEQFKRLTNTKAIEYYKIFLNNRKNNLRENIEREVSYFKYLINKGEGVIYIGYGYGEIPSSYGKKSGGKVYVDLSSKEDIELINIAIIKLKIEEDFVNFALYMFFQIMLDYKLINQHEYNIAIYGTDDLKKLNLLKMGLTISIINRLNNDDQLKNIYLDENNNLQATDEFIIYKNDVDDFYNYELSRFL